MARKVGELFGLNHSIHSFSAACCFNEGSRGSVLCLLNATFKKWFHNAATQFFYAKINDHGVQQGNMGQILAWWWRPVASRVALDLPYWTMRSALYRLIRMATEMAHKADACFSVVSFMSCITIAKWPCYGQFFKKPSYTIVCYHINLVCILWWQWMSFWLSLPMTGKRLLLIDREAVVINYFPLSFMYSTKTLWWWPRSTPSAEAPGAGVCSANKTMPLEGQTAPSWWVCLCACVSLTRCLPSGSFFVPAGTDLAVKLLPFGRFGGSFLSMSAQNWPFWLVRLHFFTK